MDHVSKKGELEAIVTLVDIISTTMQLFINARYWFRLKL
jgi:hypothetical protein